MKKFHNEGKCSTLCGIFRCACLFLYKPRWYNKPTSINNTHTTLTLHHTSSFVCLSSFVWYMQLQFRVASYDMCSFDSTQLWNIHLCSFVWYIQLCMIRAPSTFPYSFVWCVQLRWRTAFVNPRTFYIPIQLCVGTLIPYRFCEYVQPDIYSFCVTEQLARTVLTNPYIFLWACLGCDSSCRNLNTHCHK